MDLKGLPVTILDTAGLRDAEDDVERIGIDMGKKRASAADLRIYLLESIDEPVSPLSRDDIIVLSKADRHVDLSMPAVSGRTGLGMDDLVGRVATILLDRVRSTGTATRARHAAALRDGVSWIGGVLERLSANDIDNVDILAEDVRAGIRALDLLVGRVDVETLLDEIFTSFCIGK
jgi:tRNA modification GTPase